jgi:hypothetical protein
VNNRFKHTHRGDAENTEVAQRSSSSTLPALTATCSTWNAVAFFMNARYVSMKNWRQFVWPLNWLLIRIVGPASEYRDSVIQDWFDDGETLAHGFRRAGKVNDQRV